MYHMIVKRKIKQGFRHLSAGDYEAVLRQFAANVQFSFAGDHALSGKRESVEAVRQWFQRLYRFFPGLRFEIHDVIVRYGSVVARTDGRPASAFYSHNFLLSTGVSWRF